MTPIASDNKIESRAVTLRDVAQRAGVSVMVASRALRGEIKGKRSDALERSQHIRTIARSINYRRDLAATATRQRRFNAVALVLSAGDTRRSNLPPGLLAGITEALDEHDMHLSLARLPDAALTDANRVPRLLRDLGVDGLLVNYNQWVPPEMNRLIEAHGIPAVWLNDKRPLNAVYPDDFHAGMEGCQRLLDQGHRRICYIGRAPTNQCHYSEIDRRRGYLEVMRQAGLEPEVIDLLDQEPLRPTVEAWKRNSSWPGAMVAYNSRLAGELRLLLAERGRNCRRDYQLLTFTGEAASLSTDIQALHIPDFEVGRQGVNLLRRRIVHQGPLPSKALAFTVNPVIKRGECLPAT